MSLFKHKITAVPKYQQMAAVYYNFSDVCEAGNEFTTDRAALSEFVID